MPTPLLMPQLGESAVEGTIGRWLKKEGDSVKKYEPLVEINTDKVNVEFPSPVSGVLVKIVAQEGQVVPVGGELALVETAERVEVVPRMGAPEGEGAPPREGAVAPERGARYSPLVRRLAQEHGVPLDEVSGSGLGGRVTKDDVLAYVAAREGGAAAPTPAAPIRPTVEEEEVPLTPMRRTIAQHMVQASQSIPHAWTVQEVDVAKLVRHREAIKEEFLRREGVELTYLPFVIKATVETLREHPRVNSTWRDGKIFLKKRINIGIAVATEAGLIVPVIRDADGKSIAALAREARRLSDRAREGKLSLDDVQGGTFTVNNTGVFGSVVSMPIVNYPQAAVLTTEAIVRRPVVVEDAVTIRSMMNICLSFDHRILDGADVGAFMRRVKALLEAMGPNTPLY